MLVSFCLVFQMFIMFMFTFLYARFIEVHKTSKFMTDAVLQ